MKDHWNVLNSCVFTEFKNREIAQNHKFVNSNNSSVIFFNIWQLIQPMEDLSNLHNHNKQEVMFQVELKIMPKMFGDKFSRLVQDTPVSNTLERAHMEWWCKFWLFRFKILWNLFHGKILSCIMKILYFRLDFPPIY